MQSVSTEEMTGATLSLNQVSRQTLQPFVLFDLTVNTTVDIRLRN